jgi:AhpC/TSA family
LKDSRLQLEHARHQTSLSSHANTCAAIKENTVTDATPEINIGSPAPDFSLESNTGILVRLSEYRGRANVVLYFMREFT